jgi:hypothetical protein
VGKVEVLRMPRDPVTLISEVSCDCCGKTSKHEEPSEYMPAEFWPINLHGGWGSDYPGDLHSLELIVCSECVRAWVSGFKRPVEPRERGPGASLAYRALDSETRVEMLVEAGWVRPAGAPLPEEDAGSLECWPDAWPLSGFYQHFKGGLYRYVDVVLHHETREPHVTYVGLQGESECWVRPLSLWAEHVVRDGYAGPRFRSLR